MRRGAKPGKTKVNAKPPIARTAQKREGARVRDLKKRLAEALEQQTATSEILRVISSSPTDYQPVFDTIVRNAGSVCGALDAILWTADGDDLVIRAHHGPMPGNLGARQPVLGSVAGRAVSEVRVVHVENLAQADDFPFGRDIARRLGWRTTLAVPLLREGVAVGAILIRRSEVRSFTPREIELLQTFADQAVIAIENVRLFNETKEALEQQTATGDILRVIASSPTDVQPVFDAIVTTGARLCEADFAMLARYDGTSMSVAAHSGATAEEIEVVGRVYPTRPTPETLGGRAILERAVVHIPDVRNDPTYGPGVVKDAGWRTGLGVPLLREGAAIGVAGMWRRDVRPFSDRQIALLRTFADQAVIAVENARLFTELQEKNQALADAHSQVTEALEQQTATSEILRVISSSPTDVQPTFDAIAAAATRLCEATNGLVFRFDGQLVHLVAHHNVLPERLAALEQTYPRPADRKAVTGRVVMMRAVVHVPDVAADPEYGLSGATTVGYRTALGLPMLREGTCLGVILVARDYVAPFSDKQAALLRTFADQAVIAIENVRLFTELQTSNRELTAALDTQTATADILRAISQAQTDVQPVFDAIVASAVRLLEADSGLLTRIAGDQIEIAALTSTDPAGDATLRAAYPVSRHSDRVHARVIRNRVPLNVADAQTDPRLPDVQHATARARGYRSQVAVPLLRHDEALGAIAVTRREPGGFTDDEIALLQTFADQAVIAIENVRLFTELQQKNVALTEAHAQVSEALDQQTATGEILSAISNSPTAVQPVFDTIVRSARALTGAQACGVFILHEDVVSIAAHDSLTNEWRQEYPRVVSANTVTGRSMLERATVHARDLQKDPEYAGAPGRRVGIHTVLAVPMLRKGQAIGAIGVWHTEVRPFSDKQIALLETFADQAVIAIENVRLFTELQARTGELTRSVEKLTALGQVSQAVSATLDLETVLATIVSRAVDLSGGYSGIVYEFDETAERFHARATHRISPEHLETLRATPVRLGEGAVGRAGVIRQPVEVADIEQGQLVAAQTRGLLIREGMGSLVAVPLVREDQLFGGLVIVRRERGAFAPEAVATLQTFATPSALAIQNARLFREIEVKSRQLEAASQHKSEFLANMSHELRTPLNAIIGYSELLEEEAGDVDGGRLVPDLQKIATAAKHQLSLINDILDLSKVEAGRMELEVTAFDLPMAIDNCLTLVRERATRRGIALGHTIDDQVGVIHADERKVKQALLNLLSNALKFTPEGGRIDVRATVNEALVEVSVSDTGAGIAPEDQAAVFEEFRQVGTADKKVEGTGLGLALCRRFVELHGGRIWVTSQVGQGATFAFTVPVRREA